MNIWNCKAAALALTLLAGCEDGTGGAFLDGLNALGNAGPDVALSQARMGSGALNLVPPRGFCIDKRSLKQNFALLARCDKLGVPSAAADAPLGLLTVSLATVPPGMSLPSANATARALDLERVGAPIDGDGSILFRVSGDAPLADAGPVHWRGTAIIGTQLLGLALYGPENGRAVSAEGRAVLFGLIANSSAASGEAIVSQLATDSENE